VQATLGKPCNAALRDEIRALPGVRAATCSLMAPFANGISNVVRTRHEEAISLFQGHVDFDFFEVYGIEPIAGRLFSRARAAADAAPTGENATREAPLVLNETAVRRLGFASNEAAVGQTILFSRLLSIDGRFSRPLPAEILGVVADFPMGSIRTEVAPTVYFVDPNLAQAVHVKLDNRHDISRTLEQIDALWKRLGDPRPVSRRFAEENIERLYASITRQTQAFGAFSAVALFIASCGLFGLSAFATERRTREVGIRKALGASRADIVRYFLWQFTKPVLWAAVVALPVAYVFARRWLNGFAYRIDLDASTFAAAALLTWVIACVTVLAHVLRAARARPVEALRYE
jgi:putative ABC transport system permease protein